MEGYSNNWLKSKSLLTSYFIGGAKQAGCTTLYSPNNTVRGQLTSGNSIVKLKFNFILKNYFFKVIACSHLRVPMLYSESVNSACQFQSVKCGSLSN